jgi:hypothetical protein
LNAYLLNDPLWFWSLPPNISRGMIQCRLRR